uniref:Uncharacterized protein n=1 Tax=Phytophthora infestans TaxID=4787 RepID=Q572H5_PHYIN|nr:hypothetical protein PI49.0080 [Phytophthora infestans]
MARTRFQQILGELKFPDNSDTSVDKKRDPLWHRRAILIHFQDRFTDIATPSALESPYLHAFQTRRVRGSFLRCGRLGFTVRAFSLGQRIRKHVASYTSSSLHRAVSRVENVSAQYIGATRDLNQPEVGYDTVDWWVTSRKFYALLPAIVSSYLANFTRGIRSRMQLVHSLTMRSILSVLCLLT